MKKQTRIWLCSAAAVLACAAVLAASLLQGEPGRGVLYRVSGGAGEMYLLGSIHVGSDEMYPFSPSIRAAIRQADVLVFECDTASKEARESTARLMQGTGLKDAVSPECYARAMQAAQHLGLDSSAVEGMKPWAAASLFSTHAAARQLGEKSARSATAIGVEEMVRRQAVGKPCHYLETAQEQLMVMDSFSPQLQEHLLQEACETALNPTEDETLQLWPKWWAEGNADAFAASYLESFANEKNPALAQEYHDALITQRNRRMARGLQTLLESPEAKRCFVTVGLMHLVLPGDSILAELTAMGYEVEKIED